MPERIVTKAVDFKVNGNSCNGYLAHPDGDGKYPVVVVIQEWWGLDNHIKDITERLARLGFAAIAPDLYHGQVTAEPDEARKLAMALEYETASKEIDAAADWLLAQDMSSGSKFGCIGFCMGGGLVLTTAIRNARIGAAVVYYGGLPNPPENLKGIQSPVLGFFGEDESERATQLEQIISSSDKPVEVHIYEGASHGFYNDSNPRGFNLTASYDAWPRTVRFLSDNLSC